MLRGIPVAPEQINRELIAINQRHEKRVEHVKRVKSMMTPAQVKAFDNSIVTDTDFLLRYITAVHELLADIQKEQRGPLPAIAIPGD